MAVKETVINFEKMSRPAAIKLAMAVLNCTKQEAMEFIALSLGETTGDIVSGGGNEKEPSASRTKEAGSAEEVGDLREDGEGGE
jgi:hypothetical protein